jgi:hypothetical protein
MRGDVYAGYPWTQVTESSFAHLPLICFWRASIQCDDVFEILICLFRLIGLCDCKTVGYR